MRVGVLLDLSVEQSPESGRQRDEDPADGRDEDPADGRDEELEPVAAGDRVVEQWRSAPPLSIGRSEYRMVEEGLTNARKHARHAAVTVELTGRPGLGLDLCVRNPVRVGADLAHAGPSGFGLVGLAERAAASHGRFSSGLTPTGDFLLQAWLPWER